MQHILILRRQAALALATMGLLAGAALPALAETWPARPIKLIVPFAPGGGADTLARPLAESLRQRLGQPVVIENRTGAGSTLGTEFVAKAAPDGYTFLMVTIGHAVNPYMYSKLPYDTKAELTPVAVIANVPSLVVVGPGFAGKTLRDLVAAAKAKANDIQYASSGIGSTSHVGAALMESLAGIDMLHVPYKGAAPALQDVMGGRVPMSVDIITSSIQQVKADKLRALAITSAKRSPQLPDVPTVAEAGIPGYDFSAWYMLIAPAKTPPAIIRLEAKTVALSKDLSTIWNLLLLGVTAKHLWLPRRSCHSDGSQSRAGPPAILLTNLAAVGAISTV